MTTIEIWSDVKCPWCYVGKRRFEKALADFPHRESVEVIWKSYQLDPSLPTHYDGTYEQYLAKRKGISPEQVRQMWETLLAQAKGEGLNFDLDRAVVGNSFTAHRFLHLARSHGHGDAAKEAVLSAHFEQGLDTSNVDVLISIGTGTGTGISEEEIRETVAGDRFSDDVRRDIEEARTLGISGVPFYVIDRKYGISGAQPTETFRQALDQAWQESHPLVSVVPSADGPACGPEGC
ncbi:DsbA family protein [Arthrobacter sp. CAN_C5]|uniref:DsbA family oxidoreductase n=1 Tax=Arthrobacter sp. CAN_C5 TaxID=2760706 RepID=UPI001AE72490|nr:DsbA family oxidoreductase [Arthrobacter sp. CAN_C5]MBP2217028.1 putative DsbA family dithiol-disulfide isomerase [Arthrobacter sp. CAN_C5]